jgi:hypothetical protein
MKNLKLKEIQENENGKLSFPEVVRRLNAGRPKGTKEITLEDVLKKLWENGFLVDAGNATQKALDQGILQNEYPVIN